MDKMLPPSLVVVKSPQESGITDLDIQTMLNVGTTGKPSQVVFAVNKEEVVIGRVGECDVVLNHITVSRKHASIKKTPDGYVVMDLKSANGLRVNDKDVTEAVLKDDDEIQIGNYTLRFIWK